MLENMQKRDSVGEGGGEGEFEMWSLTEGRKVELKGLHFALS